MEVKQLYEQWLLLPEDLKFAYSFLNSKHPIFGKTIEGLSAFRAYQSLPKEERIEFGIYCDEIDPLFFSLDSESLSWVERTLPPYPLVVSQLYKTKGLKEEEIEIINKRTLNPLESYKIRKKRREIVEKHKLISDEFEEINQKIQERRWKIVRNTMIPFYGISALGILMYSQDPLYSLISWSLFPILFNVGRYITFKTENKRIKNFIDKSLTSVLILTSPQSYVTSFLEYGLGASLISILLEKYWPYVPRKGKKALYWFQTKSSGIKTKEFDEKRMRELLYNVKINSENIPNDIVENFKERIDNGIIEIEDPRKTLLSPYSLSYFRRKKVAFLEGNEVKIIDNEYVKKLAQIEGTFLKDFENKLKRNPTEYLGISISDGKIYFVRDIIGILPSQIEGGLACKEAYCCLLGKRSDKIFLTYIYEKG